MFEEAVRNKYRFESIQGVLSTEDLWDLRLTGLNDVAKRLSAAIRKEGEEDFVELNSHSATRLVLEKKLDLVKHVIKVRKEEVAAHEERVKKGAEKERLLNILANKQDEQLQGLSMEELQARIQAL
jgi:hypothetical protein